MDGMDSRSARRRRRHAARLCSAVAIGCTLLIPAVADAGVAGLPDAEWGEAVTAFVVLRSPATSAELLDWCRAGLAPFKVPKAVHEVSELPRNASGKLLRHRLESPPA